MIGLSGDEYRIMNCDLLGLQATCLVSFTYLQNDSQSGGGGGNWCFVRYAKIVPLCAVLDNTLKHVMCRPTVLRLVVNAKRFAQ